MQGRILSLPAPTPLKRSKAIKQIHTNWFHRVDTYLGQIFSLLFALPNRSFFVVAVNGQVLARNKLYYTILYSPYSILYRPYRRQNWFHRQASLPLHFTQLFDLKRSLVSERCFEKLLRWYYNVFQGQLSSQLPLR